MTMLATKPATTCGCQATTATYVGRVVVQGHKDDCNAARPHVYTWLANENDPASMRLGTLKDYGRAWKDFRQGHGDLISTVVKTWNAAYPVEAKSMGVDDEGNALWLLSAGPESTEVTLDATRA